MAPSQAKPSQASARIQHQHCCDIDSHCSALSWRRKGITSHTSIVAYVFRGVAGLGCAVLVNGNRIIELPNTKSIISMFQSAFVCDGMRYLSHKTRNWRRAVTSYRRIDQSRVESDSLVVSFPIRLFSDCCWLTFAFSGYFAGIRLTNWFPFPNLIRFGWRVAAATAGHSSAHFAHTQCPS